jgi:hypothetical protein
MRHYAAPASLRDRGMEILPRHPARFAGGRVGDSVRSTLLDTSYGVHPDKSRRRIACPFRLLSVLSALLTGRERNGQNSAESCRGLARYNGKFSLDGGSRSRGLVWRRVNADGPGLRVGNPHQARTWTISVVAPCCTSPIHSNLIYWDGACFLGGIFCGRCRVRENPNQEADLPRQESSGSSGGISCVIQMLESPRPWT